MQAGTTQFAGAPEGSCSLGDMGRPACVCAFWPEKKAINCTSCLYNYRITLSSFSLRGNSGLESWLLNLVWSHAPCFQAQTTDRKVTSIDTL